MKTALRKGLSNMQILICMFAFLIGAAARTRAADVLFNFGDYTSAGQGLKRFTLYPVQVSLTNNSQLITRDRIVAVTGTNGSMTVSNVMGGGYRSELAGTSIVTTNFFFFPATNGLLNAKDYLANLTNGNSLSTFVQQITSLNGSVTVSPGTGIGIVDLAVNLSGIGAVTSVGLSMPAEFSVASSPITGAGTLAVSKVSQAQNLFFASPNGSSGVMSPRAITMPDLPAAVGTGSVASVGLSMPAEFSVASSPITGNGTLAVSKVSQAQNLFFASPNGSSGVMSPRAITLPDLPAGVGAGTVTSVGLSVPAEFSVAASPITSSGTLAVSKVSQAQNLFFASPNGSSGVMSPRAITLFDLPATDSGVDTIAWPNATVSFLSLSAPTVTAPTANIGSVILTGEQRIVEVPWGNGPTGGYDCSVPLQTFAISAASAINSLSNARTSGYANYSELNLTNSSGGDLTLWLTAPGITTPDGSRSVVCTNNQATTLKIETSAKGKWFYPIHHQ